MVPPVSVTVRAAETPVSPSSSRKAVKASATASAPSSRPPTTRSDPFYGHEETAVLCARFITSLFACPNIPTGVAPGSPTPTLAHFVAYGLHRTRLPPVVTFAALLLLQRLKSRFPAARGSSGHRLFISAFMIASKVICDDTYSNQSWGIVAQKMFALKEINQMEREMCGYLDWNLNISGPEAIEFERQVRYEHGPRAVIYSRSSSTSSSSADIMSIPLVNPTPKPTTVYPTPETTPEPSGLSRPVRQVRSKPSYRHQHYTASGLPSPPASPHSQYMRSSPATLSPPVPTFLSASSSLQSSPASEDCKTPSPVALGGAPSDHMKSVDMTRWPSDPRYVAEW